MKKDVDAYVRYYNQVSLYTSTDEYPPINFESLQ